MGLDILENLPSFVFSLSRNKPVDARAHLQIGLFNETKISLQISSPRMPVKADKNNIFLKPIIGRPF